MSEFTIYHNPRCSKSRQTLALLEEKGITPDIVLYLDNTPNEAELAELLAKLNLGAADILRKGEDAYKECGLSADSDEPTLLSAMASHPKLIERPIVVRGSRAVLGRPPENVLALTDS